MEFIVDTGAGVSLIKVRNLRDGLTYFDDNLINLRGINDLLIPTIGRTKLTLEIDGHSIEHTFHLVQNNFPIKTDGILGVDILNKHNFSINFKDSKCYLSRKNTILNGTETKDVLLTRYINNRSTFIIPPRSETIIPIYIINDLESGIISKKELLPQIFTSETLIDRKNPFISILNLRETPVEIQTPEMELEPFKETDVIQILQIDQSSDRLQTLQNKLRLDHLNKVEKDSILNICKSFHDLFYFEGDNLGTTDATSHKIPLVDDKPIYVRPFRLPECHREEINRQITDMERQGIIKKSSSPWNAPLLVVPKKLDASGIRKWRVVVDFRKLNNVTVGDAFPIPNITDILDRMGNSKYFTTLDLASGFHQVPINPEDSQKTAFSSTFGHFEFTRMPFGLKGAPATFQRLMNSVLSGLNGIRCFVYLDDVVIFGSSLEDHNYKLIDVLKRFRKFNLKIHPDKCEFLRKEVQYLGHVISEDGIKPDPSKISSVKDFPIPENVKAVKSFLGLAGYYRKFIKNFSEIVYPVTKLLKKDQPFIWTESQQNAFDKLKNMLTTAPILQYPDFKRKLILTTDASGVALGAILSQGEPGDDLPIAYASRTLNKPECNYSTIEKELLAIVWGIQHFRPYLYGREFLIVTDHKPLKWLENNTDLSSRLLRWRLKLEEYSYKIEYKKGKNNTNADALSRVTYNKDVAEALHIETTDRYSNFIEHIKKHIVMNKNVIEKDNVKCKVTLKVHLNNEYLSIYEDKPQLFILSVTSNPDYEKVYNEIYNFKELLNEKNLKEFRFVNNDKLEMHQIRMILRYIFKNSEFKIYLTESKIEPNEEDIQKILYEYHNTPIGGHKQINKKKDQSSYGNNYDIKSLV